MRQLRSAPTVNEETKTQKSLGDLPPAAQRALAEAEERRQRAVDKARAPEEVGGRDGLDPARYGDWEVKGLATDF